MTIRYAQEQLLKTLQTIYDEREAISIARMAMEKITGKSNTERLIHKDVLLTDKELAEWTRIERGLATNRPIQYVIGEAWFCGMRFFVDENTLIPRPETEELVEWVVRESQKSKVRSQKILDIGTGSGCIPIALKKKLPGAEIRSVDISSGAVLVASQNAASLSADIILQQLDFIDEANWSQLAVYDIIVSNPPYIREVERQSIDKHVTSFEPAVALFVPDIDPLIFYRKIALFAKDHLDKDGMIFFEINEELGEQTSALLKSLGYDVELRKDFQGRSRMIKCKFSIDG